MIALKDLLSLKKILPFKIGATSYVTAGGLADNLRFLAPLVDDMQLTLFDTPSASNIPTRAEALELRDISRDFDISISVHLPGALDLGSPDAAARARDAELFRRIVDSLSPIEPTIYVMHSSVTPVPHEKVAGWAEREARELERLIPLIGSPRALALENVEPGFEVEEILIPSLCTSTCIDIGHLEADRVDAPAHIARWAHLCTAMHIHAVAPDGRDHASLAMKPRGSLIKDIEGAIARDFRGVMTIEVFERDDFESSFAAMADACDAARYSMTTFSKSDAGCLQSGQMKSAGSSSPSYS